MTALNRYSALVFWMKVALPLLAIALLSTLFLFARTPNPEAALPFAEVDVAEIAAHERLSNPRFAGTLDDGRAVTLRSATAAPMLNAPNRIRLQSVLLELELSEVDTLALSAQSGLIDVSEQTAEMTGGVRLESTHGYLLETTDLSLSISDFQVVAPGPIVVEADRFSLQAGAMRLSGEADAETLHFTDGVRLIYERQREEDTE